ncbi:hypothetical protein IT575_00930 [bacterium]|nr:hypothetical protein [bacterium]
MNLNSSLARVCQALALTLLVALPACAVRQTAAPELGKEGPFGELVRSVQLELPRDGRQLAKPSELLRSISTTPNDIDRVIGGAACNPTFSNRVTPTATIDLLRYWYEANASYSPNYVNGVSKSLEDAAYGQYWFDSFGAATGDYDIYLRWVTPPAPGTAFIGLSDWDRDGWVWYPVPASGRLSVSDTQRFVSDGPNLFNILMATVMLTGTEAHELDYVLIGEPTNPPMAVYIGLDSDVTQNLAPRTVDFQVQIPLAGTEVKTIEMDLDGQPGYEISDDDDGINQYEYTVPGDYTVRFRVTDELDRVFNYEDSFTIVNPSNQLPTVNVSGSVASGPAPLDVIWDASGSTDPDGQIIRYRWNIDADSDWDFTTTEPELTCSYGYEGQIFCVVEAQDNDFGLDTGTDFVTITSGWKTKLLDTTNPQEIDSLDICQTFGGGPSKAVLAYSCYNADRINTISSMDSAGVNWNSIKELAYTGDRLGGIDPSICALASGTPVIAFGEEVSDTDSNTVLKLAKATNWAADAWNAPITIDAGTGTGEDNCIELIDGQPSIVSKSGGISSSARLHYYRCADAMANSWGSAQMIGELGPATFDTPALFDGSSGPILAVGLTPPVGSSELNILVAADASGTAWGNQTIWDGERADFVSFAPDDSGKPILAYGFDAQDAVLRKVRGSNDGHTWPGVLTDLTPPSPRSGGACEIAVWNGLPIICFQSWSSGELMAMQSMDTQGTSWGEPYSIWSLGQTGELASMTVVSGLFPVIAFTSDVAAGSELWVAYWDGP